MPSDNGAPNQAYEIVKIKNLRVRHLTCGDEKTDETYRMFPEQTSGQFHKYMQKLRLVAGLLGLTGVGLGAFGAHALKEVLSTKQMTSAWETAVLYQLVHCVAIYATSISKNPVHAAGWAWTLGVVLFSGSLFAMALGGPSWLGPITPIGGLALIVGWALVIKSAITRSPTP